MTDQTKFPDKIYCNVSGDADDAVAVYAYQELETAAQPNHTDEVPVRVGIYQLVEVVEARAVTSVETVKVEN
jgi:hypothetical protein